MPRQKVSKERRQVHADGQQRPRAQARRQKHQEHLQFDLLGRPENEHPRSPLHAKEQRHACGSPQAALRIPGQGPIPFGQHAQPGIQYARDGQGTQPRGDWIP
jgi:hypothetical protein